MNLCTLHRYHYIPYRAGTFTPLLGATAAVRHQRHLTRLPCYIPISTVFTGPGYRLLSNSQLIRVQYVAQDFRAECLTPGLGAYIYTGGRRLAAHDHGKSLSRLRRVVDSGHMHAHTKRLVSIFLCARRLQELLKLNVEPSSPVPIILSRR